LAANRTFWAFWSSSGAFEYDIFTTGPDIRSLLFEELSLRDQEVVPLLQQGLAP
jgi:hypothetical protein